MQGYSPCKGYSLFKTVSLGQKLKIAKTCETSLYNIITVVLWKKRLKKHQIFQTWDKFTIWPSSKGYSPCKGCNLCKMVSLGKKFKMPKTWVNHATRLLELFCAKTLLEKTPNIWEMRQFWKSAVLQRPMQGLKALQNGQFASKLKNVKNMRKTILQHYLFCKINAWKNTKYSRNETNLQIGHLPKAIAHAKAVPFAKWPVWVKN